jgi:hypothetical protein
MNCLKFRRYTAARRKEIPGMVIETLKHTETKEKLFNRQVADVSAALPTVALHTFTPWRGQNSMNLNR